MPKENYIYAIDYVFRRESNNEDYYFLREESETDIDCLSTYDAYVKPKYKKSENIFIAMWIR
jgi:hypothetical protein